MTKRLMDLLLVLVALPVVLPVLAVTYLFVRVKLGSPVYFGQERGGYKGRHFKLWKFRSMTEARDSEGRLKSDAERLTPFGRKLRATSLDELPSLWNVIKGDMSLVGPRPLLIDYLSRYSPEQMRRHDVPPGLTGWAQVNGRNSLSWDAKFAYDLWYVDHHNVALDAWILVLTVVGVVWPRGISAEGHASMPEFLGNGANRSDGPMTGGGQ